MVWDFSHVPSALLFLSIPDAFDEETETIESISSKKRIQGDADRASENARRTIASASPTYDEAYTSAGDNERNAIPAAPAAALAKVVYNELRRCVRREKWPPSVDFELLKQIENFTFAQPGGPCRRMPRGGDRPSTSNSSFFTCGHSTARRSAV